MMKHIISQGWMAGVIGLAMTCSLAQAQTQGSSDRSAKTVGQKTSVTGCLQQQDKDFKITGDDGKTWSLKSSALKLEEHLNHKVTVTGKVSKDGHETDAGGIDVTEVRMLSQTCQ